jgi:methyltransferase
LISLALESYPWQVPPDLRTQLALACFILLQAGRYWCMWALGTHWNTRIIVVPGSVPIRRGPYRFLRHPNYLVVTLEFLVLPTLLHAPVTLVVFFTANLILLRQRIRLEEDVLQRETEYRAVFRDKI